MKLKMWTVMAVVACTASTGWAFGVEGMLGRWNTEKGKSVVELYRCGDKYCGKIVSLKEPTYTDAGQGPVGTPKVDRHNPDPSLRSRPLIGLTFMQGFTPTEEGKMEQGTIYDPEKGKNYRGKITLTAPNRLELRGFIGISLIGRTSVWTR